VVPCKRGAKNPVVAVACGSPWLSSRACGSIFSPSFSPEDAQGKKGRAAVGNGAKGDGQRQFPLLGSPRTQRQGTTARPVPQRPGTSAETASLPAIPLGSGVVRSRHAAMRPDLPRRSRGQENPPGCPQRCNCQERRQAKRP